ncbi:MAG: hypothetical protein JWO84_666 [Parcubacteria group bacterium]|nr:hypothetical protein [Parcubacteria group bacterium]
MYTHNVPGRSVRLIWFACTGSMGGDPVRLATGELGRLWLLGPNAILSMNDIEFVNRVIEEHEQHLLPFVGAMLREKLERENPVYRELLVLPEAA